MKTNSLSSAPALTIFGYSWEQIRSAQQGGLLGRVIREHAQKPRATEKDFALLSELGAEELYARGMYGVIDRLGLPMQKPD